MLSTNPRILDGRTVLTLLTVVAMTLVPNAFAGNGTLTASGTQWGQTFQYLGANEGSSQFNINDLLDLGINPYRIYGGMSRWEPTSAEATYGSVTADYRRC